MHALALEDVANPHQRAKVDDYGEQLFVTLRAPIDGAECGVTEQISLVAGHGYLVSFEERDSPLLEPVLTRIRHGRGRIRNRASDYLMYAVIDTVVDSYFPVIESMTVEFDRLEDAALAGPMTEGPARIYRLQRQLASLRQHAWPHGEAVRHLLRSEDEFVTEETRVFVRDCADHAIHAVEGIDQLRDRGHNLMSMLLSLSGARMNEIMKVLTIIATTFIPLTFLAGIYGMNFEAGASPWNMPELKWAFGYPAILAVMGVVALMMVAYFRRIGWIGPKSRQHEPLQ